MKSINEFLAASAVIIFPASVLVVDKIYGAVFLLVILLGIWQMIAYRKEIFPISKDEKLFFFSLSIVMVTVVITMIVKNAEMARADRFLAPILAIPAYLYFKQYLKNEAYIWLGLITGALIAGVIAYFQVLGLSYCPIKTPRATGIVHPIIFGDLALLMGVMSLAGLGWFKNIKQWMVILPVLAVAAGMLASALSLVRGGWISLPLFLLIFILYSARRLSMKINLLILGIFVLTIGTIYLIPQTGVQNRIDSSVANVEAYFDSQKISDRARHTSVGARFEMWRVAWIMFTENPIFGIGWGNFIEKNDELIAKGLSTKHISVFYHPHNQFISALAKGGVLGGVAVIIFYLFPAIAFYKVIGKSRNPEYHRIALAGLILVIGYIGFSLTESILERSRSIIFFSFYLAVFMALVQGELESTK
jgi:O-antigen ligase